MGHPQVTDADLGWLGGILDGEGCLVMAFSRGRQYSPRAVIVNTDPLLVVKAVRTLEAMGCSFHLRLRNDREGSLGKKPLWEILVTRMDSLYALFNALLPHLTTKQAKAMLMNRWIKLRLGKKNIGMNDTRVYTSEEVALAEQIRNLNDFTPDTANSVKIKSELQGKLAELAEMTSRLARVS